MNQRKYDFKDPSTFLPGGQAAEANVHPTKTKQQVNYKPSTGKNKCCGTCVMFHPDATQRAGVCDLVKGKIYFADVCDSWQAKKK